MTDRQAFFRMFRYVKPYTLSYGIGTFLYCIQNFAFPFMNSIFLGGVTAAVLIYSFSGVLSSIWLMAAMLLGVMVLVGVGAYLYIITIGYARRDLSIILFRSFIKTSTESDKHSGEGIAAINTDVDTAINILSDAFTPFLQNVIAAGFSLITVFVIDWRMGIGTLVIGLLAFFVQSRFAGPLARLGKAQLETNAESVKSLSNIFAGALTIRAYGRYDRSLIQFDNENGKLKKIAFGRAFIGMWQDLFTTVQGWLTIVLVFALGGWLAVAGVGNMDLARIMMILPLAEAIGGSMSQIGANYAALQPPIVAAKRIFNIIDAGGLGKQPQTQLGADNLSGAKKESAAADYEISINKLNFAYKDATEEALKDINLTIGENEMVAFIGESGSGKSTLLRTIIGMYERENINMAIGGQKFAIGNIAEWRSHFAYVDQSCKLFDMSIAQNISMGLQGAANDQEIKDAAKRAFAHDFITALSEGYNTPCGEKGASLSGGQKQRLAIARALCRKAPVLVFDEATSALDAESERNVMETIQNLRSNHTILLTTHNLSNVAAADKIVVMDNGRIAEIGTHTQLLEKNGLYVRLLGGEA
ncbi:MAG: ABC transporter ATP-binding protein/permease [Defluviitaleaceae bacterium]|nr:ABC transporter ATP-binding protein/permease [Defluviitaleaceae bacterium]